MHTSPHRYLAKFFNDLGLVSLWLLPFDPLCCNRVGRSLPWTSGMFLSQLRCRAIGSTSRFGFGLGRCLGFGFRRSWLGRCQLIFSSLMVKCPTQSFFKPMKLEHTHMKQLLWQLAIKARSWQGLGFLRWYEVKINARYTVSSFYTCVQIYVKASMHQILE